MIKRAYDRAFLRVGGCNLKRLFSGRVGGWECGNDRNRCSRGWMREFGERSMIAFVSCDGKEEEVRIFLRAGASLRERGLFSR